MTENERSHLRQRVTVLQRRRCKASPCPCGSLTPGGPTPCTPKKPADGAIPEDCQEVRDRPQSTAVIIVGFSTHCTAFAEANYGRCWAVLGEA